MEPGLNCKFISFMATLRGTAFPTSSGLPLLCGCVAVLSRLLLLLLQCRIFRPTHHRPRCGRPVFRSLVVCFVCGGGGGGVMVQNGEGHQRAHSNALCPSEHPYPY